MPNELTDEQKNDVKRGLAAVERVLYAPIDALQAIPESCYADVMRGFAAGKGTHEIASELRAQGHAADPASVGRLKRRTLRMDVLMNTAVKERARAASLAVAYTAREDALETLHILNNQIYKTGVVGRSSSDADFARLVIAQKTQVETIKLLTAQIRASEMAKHRADQLDQRRYQLERYGKIAVSAPRPAPPPPYVPDGPFGPQPIAHAAPAPQPPTSAPPPSGAGAAIMTALAFFLLPVNAHAMPRAQHEVATQGDRLEELETPTKPRSTGFSAETNRTETPGGAPTRRPSISDDLTCGQYALSKRRARPHSAKAL